MKYNEDHFIFAGIALSAILIFLVHAVLKPGMFLSIIFDIVGVMAIILVLISIAKFFKKCDEKKAFRKDHPHYKAEEFYRACLAAGVKNAKTEADIAKICQSAKEQSLRMSQQKAIDFFLLGQSEVTRIEKDEQRAFLNKLKAEEIEYEKYITRFAKLSAHQKVAAMCSEEALKYLEQLDGSHEDTNNIARSANRLYDMTKRKEYDWATMGGIASGIGGIGAGITVALDAQMKNAEIRQQNQELKAACDHFAITAINQNLRHESYNRDQAEYFEHKAQIASQLKVQELPPEELLAILSPSIAHKEQTKTGSIVIKVKIEPYYSHNLKIEKNRAVIDGTFKAVFWDDSTRAGEAILTLPLDNDGYREVVLEGICRSDALKYGEHYTVTFEPNKLWLVEELRYLPSSRKE